MARQNWRLPTPLLEDCVVTEMPLLALTRRQQRTRQPRSSRSSPDFVTSFHLPDAPAQGESLALRALLPAAPTLVPLAADKLTSEELIGGRAVERAGAASNIGVLIVNLGAPDRAKPVAIWRFLKETFNDPRVIEIGSRFWKRSLPRKIAVNGVILPMRSWRRTRSYRKIRIQASNELPARTITRSQAQKLIGILDPLGKHVIVDWALRYAEPSIAARLEALVARKCDRILVMPLYPQYSALTTATICDEVFRFLLGCTDNRRCGLCPHTMMIPIILNCWHLRFALS